jgi:hypothetical protein
LVLVVGIIGEYKLPSYHHRLKAFELLVLIGVGGELVADGGVFFFSRRLQNIGDLEIAGLRLKAQTLVNQNLVLQKDVLTLRAQLAWRTFTPSQLAELTELLGALGKGSADLLLYDSQNPEITELVKELTSDLKAAHWDAVPWSLSAVTSKTNGVEVSVRLGESERVVQLARSIVDWSNRNGVYAEFGKERYAPWATPNSFGGSENGLRATISFTIGPKPSSK